jgi:hypothetical protein
MNGLYDGMLQGLAHEKVIALRSLKLSNFYAQYRSNQPTKTFETHQRTDLMDCQCQARKEGGPNSRPKHLNWPFEF